MTDPTQPPAETASARDEERFEEWLSTWVMETTYTPHEMELNRIYCSSDGAVAIGFLAGIQPERERTREVVAKIKALDRRFVGNTDDTYIKTVDVLAIIAAWEER